MHKRTFTNFFFLAVMLLSTLLPSSPADCEEGIPTSGKHPQHLALPDVTCETCHNIESYPYFKSGTDQDGDNLYNLSETDVCNGCHKDGW